MTKFKFGKSSVKRLGTCHPTLRILMEAVIAKSDTDMSILCGYRSEIEQNAAVKAKRSKVSFPNSKHNSFPSRAVDVAPYPIDWDDTERFHDLAELILTTAEDMEIDIRWGGDWDMDGDTEDQTFNDLPHFELC